MKKKLLSRIENWLSYFILYYYLHNGRNPSSTKREKKVHSNRNRFRPFYNLPSEIIIVCLHITPAGVTNPWLAGLHVARLGQFVRPARLITLLQIFVQNISCVMNWCLYWPDERRIFQNARVTRHSYYLLIII